MCGITGVYCDGGSLASNYVYYSLFSLQHRGQESAGIASFEKVVRLRKGMGLVSEVIKSDDLRYLRGKVAIGHVRYSTTGNSSLENAQPFVVKSKVGYIAVAHNGNLVNHENLRAYLENLGNVFSSDSDSEVIAQLFSRYMMHLDLLDALKKMTEVLIGSYSIVALINDKLVAFRDPLGFRPLCVGEISDGYIIASESCAIDAVEGKFIKDLDPGEVAIIENGDIEFVKVVETKRRATCVFEYIYFARPDSVIDGVSVYAARKAMGEELAKESPVYADAVSAVPDSGITAAIGYAAASKIPYIESLIKNRYVGRTFIMPKKELRELSVKLKINTVRENVFGKRLILVDDSIVRGTTSRRIVQMLRNAGALEIHLRIASPPIVAPCYFGIDMKTREELIAANHDLKEIAEFLTADSVCYLSLDGLKRALKRCGRGEGYCLACLTSLYPVPVPGEKCIVDS
ncbi:MAG: amidophosphoribosyltransferase [Archaeoglobales archaeon]|nr:amidophosphoribosyltransferase [Archaeoglobales archaeon]